MSGGAPRCYQDFLSGRLRLPQKRHHASEYYDTADPFIDDSELAQDERTFFAQTKQKGFYVSSGQVALLNKYVPVHGYMYALCSRLPEQTISKETEVEENKHPCSLGVGLRRALDSDTSASRAVLCRCISQRCVTFSQDQD